MGLSVLLPIDQFCRQDSRQAYREAALVFNVTPVPQKQQHAVVPSQLLLVIELPKLKLLAYVWLPFNRDGLL